LAGTLPRGGTLPRVTDNVTCHWQCHVSPRIWHVAILLFFKKNSKTRG